MGGVRHAPDVQGIFAPGFLPRFLMRSRLAYAFYDPKAARRINGCACNLAHFG